MPSSNDHARPPLEALAGREVILEVTQHGAMRVAAAVDAATGVEAIAQGPAHAQAADLERLALGKLVRRLAAAGALGSHCDRRVRPDEDAGPDPRGLRI